MYAKLVLIDLTPVRCSQSDTCLLSIENRVVHPYTVLDAGEDAPDIRELQESTRLLQIVNDFDPYSAMSTPIYQTATFAQVSE